MSTNVIINGGNYLVPNTSDTNWGDYTTDTMVAQAQYSLYPTDVVDNLTSTSAVLPLSANQGNVLNTMASGKVSVSDIQDNLTSTAVDKPLSANQGRILNNKADPIPVIEVTGTTQAIANNTVYIAGSSAKISFTLPVTAAMGDKFQIIGKGIGGWEIKQNASQYILLADDNSTLDNTTIVGTDGKLNTINVKSSVEIECIIADTAFRVINGRGAITTAANWYGDSSDGSFTSSGGAGDTFTSTDGGDMVVKNFVNFTIQTGHTVTVQNPCKGLLIYCTGNFQIDSGGELTMTGKGKGSASGVPGGGLYIAKLKVGGTDTGSSDLTGAGTPAITAESNQQALSGNGIRFNIAKVGGAGGAIPGGAAANDGGIITNGSGGGGSGRDAAAGAGAGTDGTCFWGGAGGGGGSNLTGGSSAVLETGGDGGAGSSPNTGSGGGGAGNPAGAVGGSNLNGAGGLLGNGGLLIIIVRGDIIHNGIISSRGKAGGGGSTGNIYYGGGGGCSGGGIVLGLHGGTVSGSGTVVVTGGNTADTDAPGAVKNGGQGGDGSARFDIAAGTTYQISN
jgi:hypothetical protein